METTSANDWWICTGCGVDAEIDGALGWEQPCPDCGEAMQLWFRWEVVAA